MQKKITFVELNIKLKTTWCKKISLQIQNYPRFVLDTCDSKETAYMLRAILRNAMWIIQLRLNMLENSVCFYELMSDDCLCEEIINEVLYQTQIILWI